MRYSLCVTAFPFPRKIIGLAILTSTSPLLLGCPRAATPAPPIRFTLTDLGPLGGDRGFPARIDANGRVVGTFQISDGVVNGFVWDSGNLKKLPPMPKNGVNSRATGIDARGRIVGTSDTRDGGERAVIWEPDGTIRDRATPPKTTSAGNAIGGDGTVVGNLRTGDTTRAAAWDAAGKMRTLPLPFSGPQSFANGIAGGKIVGSATEANGAVHGLLWSKTGPLDLGAGDASGISPNGDYVVGSETTAWVWFGGVRRELGTVDGKPGVSIARGVNDAGWVVGASSGRNTEYTHAFLWIPDATKGNAALKGRMWDLNGLVRGPADWHLSAANDINARGQIIGIGVDANGVRRGFLLTRSESR